MVAAPKHSGLPAAGTEPARSLTTSERSDLNLGRLGREVTGYAFMPDAVAEETAQPSVLLRAGGLRPLDFGPRTPRL